MERYEFYRKINYAIQEAMSVTPRSPLNPLMLEAAEYVKNCPANQHVELSPLEIWLTRFIEQATSAIVSGPVSLVKHMEKNPRSLDIVREWLLLHGFDGLYNGEDDCGCRLDNMCPCGIEIPNDCRAGYSRPLADCPTHSGVYPNKHDEGEMDDV